jgi:hypothetical protein
MPSSELIFEYENVPRRGILLHHSNLKNQSPSREASSRSALQEIPRLLWNLKNT